MRSPAMNGQARFSKGAEATKPYPRLFLLSSWLGQHAKFATDP